MALAVPLAALLAAAEPGAHSPRELWTAGVVVLVFVVVASLVVVTGCGVAAVLTRPVRDSHDSALKATAESLARSLTASFNNYGENGYRPEQAFRSHYPRLWKKLERWDAVRLDAAEASRRLSEHVNQMLAENGINGDPYVPDALQSYAVDWALRRVRGDDPPPAVQWGRNFGTTAPVIGAPAMPGPQEGWLRPYDFAPIWVHLPPNPDETEDGWHTRASEHTDRIDAFLAGVAAGVTPFAQAMMDATRRVEDFKSDELPAVRDALALIGLREPPRARPFRCESC